MDCWPAWFQGAFGLLLGFIIGVGIVTLVILAEVKKLVLWAKREVHVAKEELEWLRPWAEGVTRRIRRCNFTGDEGGFLGAHMADAQTQTRERSGAREYAGDIPRGAGRSVPTSATTLSSLGEVGDYVDMSGVHARRDVGCGGVDIEATRSVPEQQRIVRYEARRERVGLPLQGTAKSGEERVTQAARSKMRASSIGHGAEGKKAKEVSEEGGASGRGQQMRRIGLMASKKELEEERGRIKARLDMLEEVKREASRRKKDQGEEESGREKVEELLGEYWNDTSRKTLVKRRIDTGDTALIRQRKEEEEVKEQARKAQEEQCEKEEQANEQSERKGE